VDPHIGAKRQPQAKGICGTIFKLFHAARILPPPAAGHATEISRVASHPMI
jgi:hypothetical protein